MLKNRSGRFARLSLEMKSSTLASCDIAGACNKSLAGSSASVVYSFLGDSCACRLWFMTEIARITGGSSRRDQQYIDLGLAASIELFYDGRFSSEQDRAEPWGALATLVTSTPSVAGIRSEDAREPTSPTQEQRHHEMICALGHDVS
jgi:hypothetical protein